MTEDPEFSRKRRGRNIAMALGLLLWVIIVYAAIMVKVHNEIRPS